MLKSALLILSGNAATSAILFIRNLLVARLISVEDYGIASTFAISMAIVEMASSIGLQQLIVQDRDGDNPALQAGLQGFHLLRGVLSGVILFFLAHPIASFLGVSEIAWAYQLLALVPVLRGFVHFDIYRLHRGMNFLPSVIATSVPAFASVLMVWPLHALFNDFRVMLYAILVQGAVLMATSHLVSERGYKLSLEAVVIKHAVRFGWPLFLNNILLFLIFQGEKLIVGRELGMEDLAIFSMGITLTLTPTLLLGKSIQSFFLPQLSDVAGGDEGFEKLSITTMQSCFVSGAFLVAGTVIFGGPLVGLLLGDKYLALAPYLTWLAVLQAFRAFKTGSSVVALAKARTANSMISNIFRALFLPVAWYVAITSGDLFAIIWIGVAGEACGYFASMLLVLYRYRFSLRAIIWPGLATGALLAVSMSYAWDSRATLANDFPPLWVTASVLGLSVLIIAMSRDLRSYVHRMFIARR